MWNATGIPAIPTSIQLYTENLGQYDKIRKKLKAEGLESKKIKLSLFAFDTRLQKRIHENPLINHSYKKLIWGGSQI